MIWSRRTAQATWTPTNVVPLRPCAQVNEDAAGQVLAELTTIELDAHIQLLDADHKIKRAALATVANSLARALNERMRRRG